MLMTAPAGALIDQTHYKRAWVIVAGVATIAASAIILLSQSFWVVAGSQVGSAVAGAAIIPAVNAITLGIVHQWHEWSGDHSASYWCHHLADYLHYYDTALALENGAGFGAAVRVS